MRRLSEQERIMLKRIKETSDGKELIDFLVTLSKENYAEFKVCSPEHNDIVKGKAIAIDTLINYLSECDKIEQQRPVPSIS